MVDFDLLCRGPLGRRADDSQGQVHVLSVVLWRTPHLEVAGLFLLKAGLARREVVPLQVIFPAQGPAPSAELEGAPVEKKKKELAWTKMPGWTSPSKSWIRSAVRNYSGAAVARPRASTSLNLLLGAVVKGVLPVGVGTAAPVLELVEVGDFDW